MCIRDSYYDAETLQRMGYPAGVVVASVAEGSPAGIAGIQKNDIITKINGTAVASYAAMISEKNKYNAGDTITVTVYRDVYKRQCVSWPRNWIP